MDLLAETTAARLVLQTERNKDCRVFGLGDNLRISRHQGTECPSSVRTAI